MIACPSKTVSQIRHTYVFCFFQGDVYQTLSNPELRKKYDKHGIEAMTQEDGVFMDSEQLFSMVRRVARIVAQKSAVDTLIWRHCFCTDFRIRQIRPLCWRIANANGNDGTDG